MTSLDKSYRLIRKPIITEKATDDQATRNAYHFRVPADANKVEIRQAIESLFETSKGNPVRVKRVNTLRVKPKWRRRGYTAGQTRQWKKAMVVLQDGHSIDLI